MPGRDFLNLFERLRARQNKSIMQTRVMPMCVSGIFHGLLTQSLHHIMTMGRRDSVTCAGAGHTGRCLSILISC